MRIVFGEFANAVVASQRVMPGVLNRAGYRFQHSDVDSAIRAALER
jgi:NAD dependent epimerase/dehydratase family enzyme